MDRLHADHPTRTVTAAYRAQGTDYTIRVDASAGAVTVSLPEAAALRGKVLVVKKVDSSANAVTIDPAGSETIDGASTVSISTQYHSYVIQSSGSSWDVLARRA